jgi:hypothetical protein
MSKAQPGSGYGLTSSGYGFTLNTSDPFPSAPSTEVLHPFKIVNASIRTSGGANSVIFQVRSGILNNLVPIIDDYVSGVPVKLDRVTAGVAEPPTAELVSSNFETSTKKSYIVLRAGAKSTSDFKFPDTDVTSNRYPVIIGGNAPPVDDDTHGFILLGTITVDNINTPTTFTVSQNITGSLWGDRIKLAGITARYYFARI